MVDYEFLCPDCKSCVAVTSSREDYPKRSDVLECPFCETKVLVKEFFPLKLNVEMVEKLE